MAPVLSELLIVQEVCFCSCCKVVFCITTSFDESCHDDSVKYESYKTPFLDMKILRHCIIDVNFCRKS